MVCRVYRSYSVPKTLRREREDTTIHCCVKKRVLSKQHSGTGSRMNKILVVCYIFDILSSCMDHIYRSNTTTLWPHRQWSVVLEWHKCRYVPVYRSRVALHNIHILWFDCCCCLLRLLWNTRTALPGERLTSTGTTSTVVSWATTNTGVNSPTYGRKGTSN